MKSFIGRYLKSLILMFQVPIYKIIKIVDLYWIELRPVKYYK